MAADLDRIVGNLLAFYDFSGRVVISVGAGGGQLVEYGRKARKVVAIDSDAAARQILEQRDLAPKFELICQDFSVARARGDVVLFEFSLHEMDDPSIALRQSRSMAPDTVVFDHLPGSDWAYYVAEEEKVQRSWNAVASMPVRSRIQHDAVQRFASYEELREKVRPQGRVSLDRVQRFSGAAEIIIPMKYGIALL
jgi:hypothetical protein